MSNTIKVFLDIFVAVAVLATLGQDIYRLTSASPAKSAVSGQSYVSAEAGGAVPPTEA